MSNIREDGTDLSISRFDLKVGSLNPGRNACTAGYRWVHGKVPNRAAADRACSSRWRISDASRTSDACALSRLPESHAVCACGRYGKPSICVKVQCHRIALKRFEVDCRVNFQTAILCSSACSMQAPPSSSRTLTRILVQE